MQTQQMVTRNGGEALVVAAPMGIGRERQE